MSDQWPDPSQQPPPYPPQQYDPRLYPPQYGQPPYQQPYQPPPRRRGPFRWLAIGCLGTVGLIIVIVAVAASHSSSSLPAALPTLPTAATVPAQSQPAAPASTAAKAAAKLAASFTGSGAQKTATFTVTSTWAVSYSFDCSTFGQTGNFQVYTDGGSDFNGVIINDLAMSKSAVTYAYGDAGTHYLEINSECSWSVKVYDEG